jgi:hypothetical protein
MSAIDLPEKRQAFSRFWSAARTGYGRIRRLCLARISPVLLRLSTNRSVLSFYRNEHIQVAARWIENNIMVRRRERRARLQKTDQATQAYLKTHFCELPFTRFETTHTGLAFVCCPIWLPTPIGTLDTDPLDLWNGPLAQSIRASIAEGSFRYCNHLHCSRITNRTLLPREAQEAQALLAAYAASDNRNHPKDVILSHDKSCNISCPSCRSQPYMAGKARQAELDRLMERTVFPLLRQAETVMITGSGDAFGSNHFRHVIKRLESPEFSHLKIDLHTNGQLWDERAWQELKLTGRVRYAHVSIDAARADTYAIVRRGGSFERLLRNLAFIRSLRESGEIDRLEFSMVVQAQNFREMPEFVQLGRHYTADAISFQMIRQRDLFSRDDYEKAFIGSPSHPDHASFIEVLNDPELSRPSVLMGNVLAYVR